MRPRSEPADEVLAAIERERRRIGDQLHEKLCQSLAVLSIQVALLGRQLQAGKPVDKALETLGEAVQSSIDQAHAISRELQSPRLEGSEFIDALRELAKGTATPCEFVCTEPVAVPAATSLSLLRIAEEAARNAVRHAAAKKLTISLRATPRALTLEVRDDGQGLGSAPTVGHKLSGLALMHRHASEIQAKLEVRSQPGQGTVVLCTLPYRRPPRKSDRNDGP
jgi:signal transduction histidine kinase